MNNYSKFISHFKKNIQNRSNLIEYNNKIIIGTLEENNNVEVRDFIQKYDINECYDKTDRYLKINGKRISSIRLFINRDDPFSEKCFSNLYMVLSKKYFFLETLFKLQNKNKMTFFIPYINCLSKYRLSNNMWSFVNSIVLHNRQYNHTLYSIVNNISFQNKIIIYDKIDNSCFTNDLFGKRVLLTQLRKEYLSELDEYNIDYSYFTFYAEYPNIVDFLYRAYMNTVNNPDDKDNYDDTNEEDVDMSNNMIATSVTPIEKRCLAVLERTYNVAQIDNILDGNDYMDSGSNDVIISDLSLNYDLGIKDGIIDYSFNEITRGYINKVLHLRRSKFCVVHNNVPEKHRSYLLMECLMSGCIPIIDDTIRPDDFLVPLEKGVHYLRMPEDKDVNSLVGEIDEVTREKMSLACLEYYGENVYSKNIFSTIFNMFCKFKK